MIYLDYNATCPCDPEVLETMLPYFSEKFGNPASRTHAKGWQADEAVKQAANQLAGLINCDVSEIIFTSGATESCNLAIKGVYERMKIYGDHIITCSTEHKAVLDACEHLRKDGAEISCLPADSKGHIDLEDLKAAITDRTVLIAIMYANNETGVLHPVQEIGAIARANKVYFFCDATQAIGKVAVDVRRDNIDLLALSAHKFYGPKGVGALYISRRSPRVQLIAQIDGGGHQNGFRSGTLNVPGIVGMGKAAAIASSSEHLASMEQVRDQRDQIESALLELPRTRVNGDTDQRLPNVINIAFEGIKAERLISLLNNELAFSVGSACTSAQQKASHVLQAMELPASVIEGSVRLSLGKYILQEDIAIIIEKISRSVLKLRG